MFAIEARDFTCRFTFDGALFQVSTFIASDFALPDTELGFEFAVSPIKLEYDQRPTFDLAFAVKFVDLLTVQQKFAHTFCRRNFMTGFFVRLNVSVIEKRLAVLDACESVADIGFAGTNRFNLAAFQFDTGFVALENVKIAERLAISDRLGGHDRV